MPKLRRMLCDINSPVCRDMMRLIETQSQRTLSAWAVDFAGTHYLPLYQAACPGDTVMADLVSAARKHFNGELLLKDVKGLIRTARTRCGELTDPVALAAGRAISTACAVLTTPTNALGFQFYGAAAVAYSEKGLSETPAVYDAIADAHMHEALADLRRAAVENEPNPAKIDWNC